MGRREELIAKQAGKPGLRGRINAMCISCAYEQSNGGTWRQQVRDCTVKDCPLWEVRPLSEKEG